MSLVDFVVLALATWRVSSIVSQEDGPWGVYGRLRYVLGVRQGQNLEDYPANVLGEQVMCMWCIPGLVALGWTLAYWIAGEAAVLAALPFALWAVAVWIHSRGVRFRKKEFGG